MITLINNRFSFVQFAKGNTPPDCGTPILFNENGDLKFHVVLQGPEIVTALAVPLKLYLLPIDFVPTDLPSIQAAAIGIHESGFAAEKISSTKAVFYQLNKLYDDTEDNDLPPAGACFRIAIALDQTIDGEKPYWLSNCIQRDSADNEYSSVIEYRGDENSYGFHYCNGDVSNIVRLPFYLRDPQFNDDEQVYRKSDGSRKMLSSVTTKEWEGETDYFDQQIHERTKIALSHDYVYIQSFEVMAQFVKDGGYEIDWPKDKIVRIAKAGFKVFESPYLVKNDNCEECDAPYADCPALFDVVTNVTNNNDGTQTIEFTWNNDGLDIAESVSIGYKFTGSADDYTQVNGSKLSPRSVTLPLGKYDFVLTSVGSGEEGGCDSLESGVIGNVGVEPVECIGVVLETPDYHLPDAVTTQSYNPFIILTGTGPFTLSGITKPAWMTLTVVANKILFSGTPGSGDVGAGIDVSFTISNCDGGNVLDFTDTINVTAYPGQVHVSSSMPGATIISVTGITGFAFGAPIGPGGSQVGTHGAFTGSIHVQISGTPSLNPSNISIHKGGVEIGCFAVVSSNTFIFPSSAYLSSDDIFISAGIGGCP